MKTVINWRAVTKALIVVSWLGLGFALDYSFIIVRFNLEYLGRIMDFIYDPSLWWGMTRKGREFYFFYALLAPVIYILPVWLFWWKVHRKTLIENGKPVGKVIFIWKGRHGLLYDLFCIFLNRFRHMTDEDWDRFPRPISGSFHDQDLTIYYRPSILTHPLRLFRVITAEVHVGLWWTSISGRYQVLERDPKNPYLNWILMLDEHEYITEDVDPVKWEMAQKDTIFQIKARTYLMAQAAPHVQHGVIGKSSFYIDDGFKMDALEELRRHPELMEAWLKGKEVEKDG